jgi:hypothetical protein
VGEDTERASDLVGKLGDTVEFCTALDLDANKDEIAWDEAGSRATFVNTITVRLATIFDDEGNNFAGEIDVLASMFDVIKDGSAGISQWSDRVRAISIEGKVERKLEFTAHSRDAADNVSTINRAAVPSVSSNHRSFDPN